LLQATNDLKDKQNKIEDIFLYIKNKIYLQKKENAKSKITKRKKKWLKQFNSDGDCSMRRKKL
jgi:hypothetical protein